MRTIFATATEVDIGGVTLNEKVLVAVADDASVTVTV